MYTHAPVFLCGPGRHGLVPPQGLHLHLIRAVRESKQLTNCQNLHKFYIIKGMCSPAAGAECVFHAKGKYTSFHKEKQRGYILGFLLQKSYIIILVLFSLSIFFFNNVNNSLNFLVFLFRCWIFLYFHCISPYADSFYKTQCLSVCLRLEIPLLGELLWSKSVSLILAYLQKFLPFCRLNDHLKFEFFEVFGSL